MPWGRDAWVPGRGGRRARGAAGRAASAPSHWLRRSSVSTAWPNARAWGAGTGADAAVSRCCRDAAAGAAALTRRASFSERHRGGAGGRAGGRGRRGAREARGGRRRWPRLYHPLDSGRPWGSDPHPPAPGAPEPGIPPPPFVGARSGGGAPPPPPPPPPPREAGTWASAPRPAAGLMAP
ncbi:uncharacterized protein LOC112659489 [Canis lupus dingo]|uniref:uncharacterized protein LOC112659489 n=1 Tax=Canis lupus dingo TaxID=286419 RepID=UPI0020C4EAE9|nr:uncharacterized protein LOC112659489 [Canis lupus dingo]